MKALFLALSMLLLPAAGFAGEQNGKHEHPPVAMPGQFETLKDLLGNWEGRVDMGQGEQTVRVTYALTSGGTAVMETMLPGSPMEMVSVYHRDGDSLAMTHYCAMGNQPYMKLKQSADSRLVFEMVGRQGIAAPEESHMHGLTLTLKDKNTLQQDWVHYQDGKPARTVTFVFNRQS